MAFFVAGSTGLEPATSGVTGQRSDQLNYDPITEGSFFSLGVVGATRIELVTYGL